MENKVAYFKPRMILIPNGWEAEWAYITTTTSKTKEYIGEPVSSVGLQPDKDYKL
jgi:hypothetical protein